MSVIGDFLHRWIYQDYWLPCWSNMGAMPMCVIFGGAGAWLFRDRIGRRLVRWLHKHHVAHLAELQNIRRDTRLWPWPGGDREVYVRIIPDTITGRRIESR